MTKKECNTEILRICNELEEMLKLEVRDLETEKLLRNIRCNYTMLYDRLEK